MGSFFGVLQERWNRDTDPMTITEKIIIALSPSTLNKDDFSKEKGFVNLYTADPDHPQKGHKIFLLYKKNPVNEETIKTHRKLSMDCRVRFDGIRYIKGIAYTLYSMYPYPNYKIDNKTIYLSTEEKRKVIDFWGLGDEVTDWLLKESYVWMDITNVPPEDPPITFDDVLTIKKERPVD